MRSHLQCLIQREELGPVLDFKNDSMLMTFPHSTTALQMTTK